MTVSNFLFRQAECSSVLEAATRSKAAVHADPRAAGFFARHGQETAMRTRSVLVPGLVLGFLLLVAPGGTAGAADFAHPYPLQGSWSGTVEAKPASIDFGSAGEHAKVGGTLAVRFGDCTYPLTVAAAFPDLLRLEARGQETGYACAKLLPWASESQLGRQLVLLRMGAQVRLIRSVDSQAWTFRPPVAASGSAAPKAASMLDPATAFLLPRGGVWTSHVNCNRFGLPPGGPPAIDLAVVQGRLTATRLWREGTPSGNPITISVIPQGLRIAQSGCFGWPMAGSYSGDDPALELRFVDGSAYWQVISKAGVFCSGDLYAAGPDLPPSLRVEARFDDGAGDGDARLGSSEPAHLLVHLTNDGAGPTGSVRLSVQATPADAVVPAPPVYTTPRIGPGAAQDVRVPLVGAAGLGDGQLTLRVELAESNGNDARPSILQVPTVRLGPPGLALGSTVRLDDAITGNQNGKAENGEVVAVFLTLDNTGAGPALHPRVRLSLPASLRGKVAFLRVPASFDLGPDLDPARRQLIRRVAAIARSERLARRADGPAVARHLGIDPATWPAVAESLAKAAQRLRAELGLGDGPVEVEQLEVPAGRVLSGGASQRFLVVLSIAPTAQVDKLDLQADISEARTRSGGAPTEPGTGGTFGPFTGAVSVPVAVLQPEFSVEAHTAAGGGAQSNRDGRVQQGEVVQLQLALRLAGGVAIEAASVTVGASAASIKPSSDAVEVAQMRPGDTRHVTIPLAVQRATPPGDHVLTVVVQALGFAPRTYPVTLVVVGEDAPVPGPPSAPATQARASAQTPASAAQPPGFASEEEVARALLDALNSHDPGQVLALFPTDAALANAVVCANPKEGNVPTRGLTTLVALAAARENLAAQWRLLVPVRAAGLEFNFESFQSKEQVKFKKGEKAGSCTVRSADLLLGRGVIALVKPGRTAASKDGLDTVRIGGRWYLMRD